VNNINLDLKLKKANDLTKDGKDFEAENIYTDILDDLSADLLKINTEIELASIDIELKNTKNEKLSSNDLKNKIINLGILLDKKDFKTFEVESNEIYDQAKEDSTFNYIMGMYNNYVGLFKKAIPFFKRSLKSDPSVFECIYNLGKCYHNLKSYNLAIDNYQRALKKRPKDISVLFDLSSAYYLNHDLVKSLASLKNIIKEDENNYDALCDIGLIYSQMQKPEKGYSYLIKASKINQNNPVAYNNIGVTYFEKHDFETAINYYQKSIKVDPSFISGYLNLGSAYSCLDNHEKAIRYFNKTIDLNPNITEAYSNIASTLNKQRKYSEAENYCKQALKIDENHVNTLCNYGTSLIEQKKYKLSMKFFKKAIKLDNQHIKSFYNYAIALKNLNKFSEAKENYLKALNINSFDPDNICDQAMICLELKQFNKGLSLCNKAISISANFINALYYQGLIYLQMDEPSKAKLSFKKVVKIRPDHYQALNGIGMAYTDLQENKKGLKYFKIASEQKDVNFAEVVNNIGFGHFVAGDFDLAKKSFLRSITIDNQFSPAHLNYANLSLLSEDFKTGWKYYEWRLNKKEIHRLHNLDINVHEKRWHSKIDTKNKKILIRSEQGLGDTIQFCKYAKLLKTPQNRVVIEVQNSLVDLIKTLDPGIEIVDRKTNFSDYDFQVPLLSLPLEFNTDKNNFPSAHPYLYAQKEKIKSWKKSFPNKSFKIGIAWQGSKSKVDAGRSFSVKYFKNLSKKEGVQLISLQKNYGSEQLKEFSDLDIMDLGQNFDNGDQAFLDTAAVMKNLDLIITSDTSIAHLAGALGCKTWVLLKFLPDWRWFLDKTTTPWYKNTRLFRQKELNDWEFVFTNVERELSKLIKL